MIRASRYAWISALAVISALSTSSAQADAPASRPQTAEFQIDDANHPILLPVVWQGRPGYFMLDTGIALSICDASAFTHLKATGKSTTIFSLGGPLLVDLYDPPNLDIGPIRLRNDTPVAKLDLSLLSQRLGKPIFGLLGVSSLQNFVVQIDFDQRKLRLLSPDYNPHPDWGRAFGLQGFRGSPAVMLRLSDGNYPFVLDTGWTGSIALPAAGFEKARTAAHSHTVMDSFWTLGGLMSSPALRWTDFPALGWNYRDLIINETKDDASRFGLSFLSRHTITFDFANYIIYFKPAHDFDDHNEIDMSGLTVLRIGSKNLATVAEGGPAFNAGLRNNDTILRIDNKPAADWDLIDLKLLLSSHPGRKISIRFQRSLFPRTVTFQLQRRL
jgi:PDZ domain